MSRRQRALTASLTALGVGALAAGRRKANRDEDGDMVEIEVA